MRGPRARAAIGCAAILLLAGCADTVLVPSQPSQPSQSVSVHTQPASSPATTYVAMGSSYAAGPGGTLSDIRCGRSTDNYPTRVAARLGLRLTDVTCSGATTQDLIDRAQPHAAEQPQIDAVAADTSLVTVTIGGNNVHYIGRVMAQSCQTVTPVDQPQRCNGVPPAPPTAEAYASLTTELTRVLTDIRLRAPHAHIIVVDYPPLTSGDVCGGLPLSHAEAAEATGVLDELNSSILAAARTVEGVEVIHASAAGRSHGVCSASPWLYGYQGPVPYHQTPAGKDGIASLIVDKINSR